MISRIIILVGYLFTWRDFKRFGIELLEENGFEVEVWDITPVVYPERQLSYVSPDQCNCRELTRFDNEMGLYEKLAALKKTDFVVNMLGNYTFESFRVYRTLSRSKAGYSVVMSNALPNVDKVSILRFISLKLKYISKLSNLRPQKILGKIERSFPKIPSRLLGIKPARLILAGGERCLQYGFPVRQEY